MFKENLSDDERGAWVALHLMPKQDVSSSNIHVLLDRFNMDVLALWKATRSEILSVDGINLSPSVDRFIALREQHDPERLLKEIRKAGEDIQVLAYGDWHYPSRLRHLSHGQAPLALFYRGQLTPLSFNGMIAVVGTRNPSQYGTRLAKQVGRELAEHGATVVSGLAFGIDSLAHWGAIEGAQKTIAVLATGVDLCYPSSNKPLYNKIIDGNGLVISEYMPGVKAEKYHFPARNLIVAGMSEACVVIEGAEDSGALITARMSAATNAPVFAFPGRVDSPQSAGPHKLISDKVAHFVRSTQDIVNELGWVKARIHDNVTVVELYGREKEIYEMLDGDPVHFDLICERSGISMGELSAALTMLELAGLVERMPGDWFARSDRKAAVR